MILIVNRKLRDASAISEMFYYMGIVSYPATPHTALIETSIKYRAILVMEPQTLPDPRDFVKRMRSYASVVPIFGISDEIEDFKYKEIFDGLFKMTISSATVAGRIVRHNRANKLPVLGDYRLAGINACVDRQTITHFDGVVNLSRTERMILRFLIRSYPLPMSPDQIVKYSFKATKRPQSGCIRTQICMINKKFREASGKNMVCLIKNKGYVIRTPDIVVEYGLNLQK